MSLAGDHEVAGLWVWTANQQVPRSKDLSINFVNNVHG